MHSMKIIERQNAGDLRMVASDTCLKLKDSEIYSVVFVIGQDVTLEDCEAVLEECPSYPTYTDTDPEEIAKNAVDEAFDFIELTLGIPIRKLIKDYNDSLLKPPDTPWNPPYTRKNKHDIVIIIFEGEPYLLQFDWTDKTPKQDANAWKKITWDEYNSYQ